MGKHREVSLDIHCTDDIPCVKPMYVKMTGILIFLFVMIVLV